jgi:hypothetical protein
VTESWLRRLDHAVLDAEPGSPVRRALGSLAGVAAIVALLSAFALGWLSLVWGSTAGLVIAAGLALVGVFLVAVAVYNVRRRH